MTVFVIATEKPNEIIEKLLTVIPNSVAVKKVTPGTMESDIVVSEDLSSFTTMENTKLMNWEGSLILVINEKQAAKFKKTKFIFMTGEYYEQAANGKFVLLRGKLHYSCSEFLFEDMISNIKSYILAVRQMKDRYRNV